LLWAMSLVIMMPLDGCHNWGCTEALAYRFKKTV
jgi:hypothetical protein